MVDPTLMPTPRAFCGCAACTQEVWDTIATDASGNFTCGDRISWLTTEEGMNEYEACEKVSMEFPEGPCGPVCDPFRCSNCGCASCTQKVWDTIATDYAGIFTCGARISWLTNEQGMSGYEACEKVSSEFPWALAVQRVILISAEARLRRTQVLFTRNAVELLTLQIFKY
eukprot:scaffold690_cov76-Skeletonema_dohrnii-CCMP3373.AAC.5